MLYIWTKKKKTIFWEHIRCCIHRALGLSLNAQTLPACEDSSRCFFIFPSWSAASSESLCAVSALTAHQGLWGGGQSSVYIESSPQVMLMCS